MLGYYLNMKFGNLIIGLPFSVQIRDAIIHKVNKID
jgi:hypothetical protein